MLDTCQSGVAEQTKLQEKCDTLTLRIKEMKEDCKKINEEKEKLCKDCSDLESQKMEKEEQHSALFQEYTTLSEKLLKFQVDKENEIEAMKEVYRSKIKDFQDQTDEIYMKESENQRTVIEKLKELLLGYATENTQQKQTISELKELIAALKKQLEEKDSIITEQKVQDSKVAEKQE